MKCVCIIRKDDSILVVEAFDKVKRETFYTPLGGKVEFGEYGQEAVSRELKEEMGAKVRDIRYIGTLENIFNFEGKPGHEIVLVYEARFVDRSLYDKAVIKGKEDSPEHGGAFRAVWKPLTYFAAGRVPLYPDGLLELIVKAEPRTQSPIRRVQGVTYWIIDEPDEIRAYINSNVREEWLRDNLEDGIDSRKDEWLLNLHGRSWTLKTLEIGKVRLNPSMMTNRNFIRRLDERSNEMVRGISQYHMVIWPVVIRAEDWELKDGYCRFSTLKKMKVDKILAYVGTLP